MNRDDWNRRYEGSELLWTAEPNRFLKAEVESMEAGAALDLACGEGRNAVWLAERGWDVTAVDFADVALEKATRLAEERGVTVTWVLDDLRAHLPPPASFDLVLVLYLHLPADERRLVLARAAAAVAPGGSLLVVGHHRANLHEGYGGPKDAAILLVPEEVAAELPGLTVERAERVTRGVETADGGRLAIDALVRARRPYSPAERRAARRASASTAGDSRSTSIGASPSRSARSTAGSCGTTTSSCPPSS